MSAAVGGRWIFSVLGQPVILGIDDGVHPIFPAPQPGAFNVEVFTNTTVTASRARCTTAFRTAPSIPVRCSTTGS